MGNQRDFDVVADENSDLAKGRVEQGEILPREIVQVSRAVLAWRLWRSLKYEEVHRKADAHGRETRAGTNALHQRGGDLGDLIVGAGARVLGIRLQARERPPLDLLGQETQRGSWK